MQPVAYTLLGTIQRLRGLKGHVLLNTAKDASLTDSPQTVFVQFGGTMVPYNVEQLTWQAAQAVLKLQGVDTSTAAYDLRGLSIFVAQEVPAPSSADVVQPVALIGYHVVDEREGPLGKVVDIYTPPQQTLLAVDCRAQELLIPYHADLIKHIDHDQKSIISTLPLGFLEVLD